MRALRDRFADRLAGVEDETFSVDLLVPRLIPRGPDKKQERLRSGAGARARRGRSAASSDAATPRSGARFVYRLESRVAAEHPDVVVVLSKRLGHAWLPRRLELTAAAGFAVVSTLLLVAGQPGTGLGQLFFVPIVLVALAGDRRAGVVAGVAASILYVVAVSTTPESVLSSRAGIHLVSYVAAGAIVGTFASRARGLLGESLHMLDVLLALAHRDVESGALNPEGLDAALAQRVGRAWPFALLVGELDPASDDGDELVREAVRVLTSQLGPVAEVARTGPTRVVVLAPATSQRIARETAGEAERALRADGPGATFGWAFYPAEGADAISLLQTASERLYARRIVRGEWAPTAASAGLVDELPAPRVAAGS